MLTSVKLLRQNLTGNLAIIYVSSEPKPCTRIIFRVLQFVLHFLKAKDINRCLN